MRLILPLFCVCILTLFIASGCTGGVEVDAVQNDAVQDDLSALGTVISMRKEVEIDLGEVEDDHVFDYTLEGIGEKEIKGIIRSCGCVGPALPEGDKWNFDVQPFIVNISLTGKRAGEGIQDFLISFTDDTAVRVKVKYVYLPLPSCTPDSLIFKSEENGKVVTFSFNGENDVAIESVELPTYISWVQRTFSDDSSDSLILTFALDRDNMDGEKDGVIKVCTTSKRKAQFTIPFLVLSH